MKKQKTGTREEWLAARIELNGSIWRWRHDEYAKS
jgi:hypothetical protein